MILSVHHISKSYLEVPVLQDITFHLEKGDRAAIVGNNGAGKSTLMKILTGELEADTGSVSVTRGTGIGYLAQNQNIDSAHTIYEELLEVKRDLVEMEQRIHICEQLMTQLSGEELNEVVVEYNDLLIRFHDASGYSYRGEITGILRGLGFSEDEYDQKISTLSGGQKTRIALAKILLEKPALILLDEPTNHLDIDAIRWLETYLSGYRGTILIVSHDRYFLDRTVTQIIELENAHATLFRGNYTFYAQQREALREQQRHQYLNNQAQIRHQEEVIARLRQFNREKSIRRAESRAKQLSKMERVERPVELRDDMRLTLRPCVRSGREVMQVRHLAMAFGDNRLFDNLSFDIRRGEHVAVIGSNGAGKSTLLRIIMGQLTPCGGTVRFGTNVHLGYYDQEHHVLNDSNTVFEEISDAHPDMTNTEIRNLLASFLFTGEDVFKRIADLSGGEKGRVSLAKLMLSEANLLLLDEPTNHLDLVSKEVLENALNSYEGTVLCVSHDRYFMNRTAGRILSLTGRCLLDYPGCREGEPAPDCYIGNYDYYEEKSAQGHSAVFMGGETPDAPSMQQRGRGVPPGNGTAPQEDVSSAQEYRRRKEEQSRRRKQQNDLKKCEDAISALEQSIAGLEARMALPSNCTDIAKLTKLQKEYSAAQDELSGLYEKWEQLGEAMP